MARLNLSVVCLIFVAYFVLLTRQLSGRDIAVPGQQLLSTRGFKLISRISTYSDKGGSYQIVEESYSNEQKRARLAIFLDEIAIKFQGYGLSKEYYYDSARPSLFMEHNLEPKIQTKCKHVDENTFLDGLIGFELSTIDGKKDPVRGQNWLRDPGFKMPNHVVGFARFAFWVDMNRRNFEPSDESLNFTMRGHPAKSYTLKRELSSSPIISDEIVAFFPCVEKEVGSRPDAWSGLPLAIIIRRKDGLQISIELLNVGSIRDDLIEEMDSQMPLDMFAYPVGIDCSKELKPVRWDYIGNSVLSFNMELLDYGDGRRHSPLSVSKQFVAYDNETEFMRVDSMKHYSYTVAILDPRDQNRYNFYTDSSAQDIQPDARGNIRAGDAFGRSSGQSQCIVSKFYLLKENNFKRFLPFDKMIPIGQAKLRGVDCRAFEWITNELPHTLFHPLAFSRGALLETAYSVDSDKQDEENYNLVFYFLANPVGKTNQIASFEGQVLGALMRVDVYLRGKLRYHLDISEFTYGQLTDAPNGDRAQELFSLRDRCISSRFGSLAHAKLDAEFTFKLKAPPNIKSGEMASILKSSSLRNQAVIRMLAKSARKLMMYVFDAETQLKLTDHDDELKIMLEAKMSYPDAPHSWPRLIGYATSTEPSIPLSSTECFVYAAAQNPKGSTVFMNCLNRCLVFTEPGIEFKAGKIVRYSRELFQSIDETKVSEDSCPLLSIEEEKRYSFGWYDLFRQSNWYHNDLKESILYLPNMAIRDIELISSIPATLSHIDISNDHWSASIGRMRGEADLSAIERDSVDGVGLTMKSGESYGTRIMIDNDTEIQMDYSHCNSFCLSRLECHSFSICLTGKGVECIISEIDFKDVTLLDRIESKRAELKSKTEKKTILVQGGTSETQIELKLDWRCKTHKKNTIEMFDKSAPTRVNLQKSNLFPVDSLEKCARLCFENNMKFFSEMDKVAKELGEGKKKQKETEKKLKAEWETHRVNWCSEFYYLNLAYSSDYNLVKESIQEKEFNETSGLCVPMKPYAYKERGNNAVQVHARGQTIVEPIFDAFRFVYLSLYNAQYGKIIVETTMASQTKQQVKILAQDAETCARACFLQSEKVEPQCKSFDYILIRSRWNKKKDSQYCVLHSSTLDELEENGQAALVEDLSGTMVAPDHDITMKAWHYEPKVHAMIGAMITKGALNKLTSPESHLSSSFRIHGFGIFLSLLVSIVCTIALIKWKGRAIVDIISPVERRCSMSPIATTLDNLDF